MCFLLVSALVWRASMLFVVVCGCLLLCADDCCVGCCMLLSGVVCCCWLLRVAVFPMYCYVLLFVAVCFSMSLYVVVCG